MTDLPPIPLLQRTRLAHATLQAIADECGADILHIKGPALDATLLPAKEGAGADNVTDPRERPRLSADADILVRPAHLKRFLAALKRQGWQRRTRFDVGGSAAHSTDFSQEQLGWADIHQHFPGIHLNPDQAFSHLWRDHDTTAIAHWPCQVPSVTAQRLLLLLHAARNGGRRYDDVYNAWELATGSERDKLWALARELHAEVAMASTTTDFESYSTRPEYELWRLLSIGETDRISIWIARIRGSTSPIETISTILNPFRPKLDGLALQLEREPSLCDAIRFFRRRLHSDLTEMCKWLRR